VPALKATPTKAIKVAAVAAGVVVVGAVSLYAYVMTSSNIEQPYETANQEACIYYAIEDEAEDYLESFVEGEPMQEYIPQEIIDPPLQGQETMPNSEPDLPLAVEKIPLDEPKPIEDGQPEPEAEEEIEEEPKEEPEPIDKTAEILAMLNLATTSQQVDHILSYFNFSRVASISRSIDDMWFWFYATNEGSGDILVGIASFEDGSSWRMQFEHYEDSHHPQDRLDLFDWMGG